MEHHECGCPIYTTVSSSFRWVFAKRTAPAHFHAAIGYLQKGTTMQHIDTIPVFGTHEANILEQAQQCDRTAGRFVLFV